MIYIWHFYDSTLWQYTSTQQDFDNIYPSHGAGVLPIHIHLYPFFCHCRHAFRVRWWTFWVGVPETLAVTLRSWTEPLSLFKQNHHVSYDLSFDMDVPCPAHAGPGSYLQVSSSLTANVPSAKPRLGFMMILKWPRGPSCHVFLVRKRFCFNFLLMTGWPSASLWASLERWTNSTAQTLVPAPKGVDSPRDSVGSLAAFVRDRSLIPVVKPCLGLDSNKFWIWPPRYHQGIRKLVPSCPWKGSWSPSPLLWDLLVPSVLPSGPHQWFDMISYRLRCLRPGLFGSTVQANPKFLSKRGSGVAFFNWLFRGFQH